MLSLTYHQKNKIRDFLKESIPGIELIYFFVGMTEEANNRDSDIDLAFLSQEKISNVQRFDIQEKLASILNKNVDLVDVKLTSTKLNFQIVWQGILIYSINEKRKSDFELSATGQYFDYKMTMEPIFGQMFSKGIMDGNN